MVKFRAFHRQTQHLEKCQLSHFTSVASHEELPASLSDLGDESDEQKDIKSLRHVSLFLFLATG